MTDELIRPRDEVFPIRAIGMSAIMLAPGELAIQQTHIDRWHLRGAIVVGNSKILRTQQPEYRPGCDRSHKAALLIQPFCIAFLGHAITDERRPRRAQCDQLMRVHG
jgi:hypothetical protein